MIILWWFPIKMSIYINYKFCPNQKTFMLFSNLHEKWKKYANASWRNKIWFKQNLKHSLTWLKYQQPQNLYVSLSYLILSWHLMSFLVLLIFLVSWIMNPLKRATEQVVHFVHLWNPSYLSSVPFPLVPMSLIPN